MPDKDYPPESIRVLRGLTRRREGLLVGSEPGEDEEGLIARAIALVRSAPDVPAESGDELPEG